MSQADAFLESLTDTDLYSMGAFFCDEHPRPRSTRSSKRSTAIEDRGPGGVRILEAGVSVEESFGTLLTGLAVRYYKAVAG